MTTYYKAVRPDGTDFYTGTVQWAPPRSYAGEWIVRHPTATKVGSDASEYLSVSTVPTACIGMEWPCRLLAVSAVGDVTTPSPTTLPHKRVGVAFRVTGERPAHEALGPQGEHVAALIERARHPTPGEACDARNAAKDAARSAARDAAWNAARNTAWLAARNAARDAAWVAARNAVVALVVRDLITTDQYDVLTRTWRTAIGPIHPDDPELPTERSAV